MFLPVDGYVALPYMLMIRMVGMIIQKFIQCLTLAMAVGAPIMSSCVSDIVTMLKLAGEAKICFRSLEGK